MNIERWDRNGLLVFIGLLIFAGVIGIFWYLTGM